MKSLLKVFLFLVASTAQAAIIFQDGFESGDFSHTENGFAWEMHNNACAAGGSAPLNGADPVISTVQTKSGTYSALFPMQPDGDPYMGNPSPCANAPGANDSWKELEFISTTTYQELWIKFDIRWPANYNHRGSPLPDNNKVMYWDDTCSGCGAPTGYVGWESWNNVTELGSSANVDGGAATGTGSDYSPLHLKYGGADRGHDHPGNNYFGQTSDPFQYVDTNTDLGVWHELIFHIKLGQQGQNNCTIEVWKDGVKRMNYPAIGCYLPAGLGHGYVVGWANSGFPERTDIYLDNFVVSTTEITPGGGPDTTPPAVSSATIGSAGNTITVQFSEAVTAAGRTVPTLSASGGAATLTYSSGSGTSSVVYTVSRTLLRNETVPMSYTNPGDSTGIQDLATTPNNLASFAGAAVSNGSQQFPAGCVGSSFYPSFTNAAITAQTGTFELTFKATPLAAVGGLIGLMNGNGSAYSSLATTVRFNAGNFDAVNGAGYAAVNTIPYSIGTEYTIRMPVDLIAHTYSAHITPFGGSEATLASNYAFRSAQSGASQLDKLGITDDVGAAGDVMVCDIQLSGADTTPPTLSAAGPSGTIAGTSAPLAVSTNEAATCKFGTAAGIDFGSKTAFGTTGGISHSHAFTCSPGGVYHRWFACQDAAGNLSADAMTSFHCAPPKRRRRLN